MNFVQAAFKSLGVVKKSVNVIYGRLLIQRTVDIMECLPVAQVPPSP